MSTSILGLATWVGLSLLGADQAAMPLPGVTPENEKKATELRDKGNKEFLDGLVDVAAGHYKEALQYWDHPAIHFNYAQALSKQFKLIDCHEHLEAATRYGRAPLGDPKVAEEAFKMLGDVEGQLTRLELTCNKPGARVTVDDEKDQIVCPSTVVRWMLPGSHVLSISKEGLHSRRKPVDLAKGERFTVAYDIFPEDQMVKIRYPLPAWLPWTVLGVGVGVIGAGGSVDWLAATKLKEYDDAITNCSTSPSPTGFIGCPPDQSEPLARTRSQGYAYQRVAWVMLGAGAAAVVTGVLFQLGNRPDSRFEDPDLELHRVAVAPVLAPGTSGVSLTFAF